MQDARSAKFEIGWGGIQRNPEMESRHRATKLGKGESFQNVKPFIETLRVTNPVRQSRASSRKRVLRGDG
jgi:hypothetical protein